MKYTIYRLKSPYGDPGEVILASDNRAEIMEKTAELISAGESPATIRVITDENADQGDYFY